MIKLSFNEIEERLKGLKELIERAQYGKVEQCEYKLSTDSIHVVVTGKQFDGSIRITSNLGMLIVNYIPEFKDVVSLKTGREIFKISLTNYE